jgi:phospholipid transport system transporter-binding protein
VTKAPFYSLETDSLGTLRLRGAISFTNAAQAFASPPQALKRDALDIDLAALENADSATLAVLIAWSADARRRGARLRYLRAPQGLRNLARLTEVDGLLGFAEAA